MEITSASHLDHNLTPEHIEWIKKNYAERSSFFIETVFLPSFPDLYCNLYGPNKGDEPITDDKVYMARRGNRDGLSRMIARRPRPTSFLTIIGGPHKDNPCILYTAYGGIYSPREPWDLTMNAEEKKESEAFWATHALAGFNENGEAIY